MSTLEIKKSETGHKGMFYVGESLQPDAAMTFTKAGDQLIIIDHTEVGESLRGQGVGRQLLDEAVKMAREQGKKIMPLCPYAKSVFQKDESIRDVLRG